MFEMEKSSGSVAISFLLSPNASDEDHYYLQTKIIMHK